MATKSPVKRTSSKKSGASKSAEKVIAPERKRLEQLYVFGDIEEIKDPRGFFEKVWVQKLSPSEETDALKPARAKRSRISIVKRKDPSSEEFLDYVYKLEDYGITSEEDLSILILQNKLDELRATIELRVAGEDKWAEDDYLIGLQDAWLDGLRDKYLEDSEDSEAAKVFSELEAYTKEVEEEFEPERDGLISELSHLTYEELQNKAAIALIEREAQNEMMEEFRAQRLFYAVREENNHEKRYFSSVDVIRTLPKEVRNPLEAKLEELTVGVMEGKD